MDNQTAHVTITSRPYYVCCAVRVPESFTIFGFPIPICDSCSLALKEQELYLMKK